jgi:hypothetical protein
VQEETIVLTRNDTIYKSSIPHLKPSQLSVDVYLIGDRIVAVADPGRGRAPKIGYPFFSLTNKNKSKCILDICLVLLFQVLNMPSKYANF